MAKTSELMRRQVLPTYFWTPRNEKDVFEYYKHRKEHSEPIQCNESACKNRKFASYSALRMHNYTCHQNDAGKRIAAFRDQRVHEDSCLEVPRLFVYPDSKFEASSTGSVQVRDRLVHESSNFGDSSASQSVMQVQPLLAVSQAVFGSIRDDAVLYKGHANLWSETGGKLEAESTAEKRLSMRTTSFRNVNVSGSGTTNFGDQYVQQTINQYATKPKDGCELRAEILAALCGERGSHSQDKVLADLEKKLKTLFAEIEKIARGGTWSVMASAKSFCDDQIAHAWDTISNSYDLAAQATKDLVVNGIITGLAMMLKFVESQLHRLRQSTGGNGWLRSAADGFFSWFIPAMNRAPSRRLQEEDVSDETPEQHDRSVGDTLTEGSNNTSTISSEDDKCYSSALDPRDHDLRGRSI